MRSLLLSGAFFAAAVLVAGDSSAARGQPADIQWLDDIDAARKQAAAEGKPILLAFR